MKVGGNGVFKDDRHGGWVIMCMKIINAEPVFIERYRMQNYKAMLWN